MVLRHVRWHLQAVRVPRQEGKRKSISDSTGLPDLLPAQPRHLPAAEGRRALQGQGRTLVVRQVEGLLLHFRFRY